MGVVPKPGNVLKTLAGSSQTPRHIAFKPPSLKSEILEKVFHYQNKKSKKWPTHLLNPRLESAVHTKISQTYIYINILFVCIHTPSWTDNFMHFKCVCVCVMRKWDLEQSKLPSVCVEPGSVRWDHVTNPIESVVSC